MKTRPVPSVRDGDKSGGAADGRVGWKRRRCQTRGANQTVTIFAGCTRTGGDDDDDECCGVCDDVLYRTEGNKRTDGRTTTRVSTRSLLLVTVSVSSSVASPPPPPSGHRDDRPNITYRRRRPTEGECFRRAAAVDFHRKQNVQRWKFDAMVFFSPPYLYIYMFLFHRKFVIFLYFYNNVIANKN